MIRVNERPYIALLSVPNKEIKYNFLASITSRFFATVYSLHNHVISRHVINMCLWAHNKRATKQGRIGVRIYT
jgi:hypothetical protein